MTGTRRRANDDPGNSAQEPERVENDRQRDHYSQLRDLVLLAKPFEFPDGFCYRRIRSEPSLSSSRARTINTMTIFKRIIDREIPAEIVYEDELSLAFRDINAQAPTHIVIIPKREITSLADSTDADEQLLGHLLIVARKIAEQLQLTNGYRTVINCGRDAGQSVNHLHVHLLGGRSLGWPPG